MSRRDMVLNWAMTLLASLLCGAAFQAARRFRIGAAHPERPVTNRPAGWNPAPQTLELDGILIDVQKLVQVNNDVAQVRQRLQARQLCLGLSRHLTVQKRDVFVELFGGRLA